MKFLLTILLIFSTLFVSAQFPAIRWTLSKPGNYTPPTTTYDTLQVNLWDSTASGGAGLGKINLTGWNEWNIRANADGALFSYQFLWTDGSTSPIQAAWRTSNKTGRALTAYVDNTAPYASGQTTNFPTGVFRVVGYNNGNDLGYLMFTGLDDAKTYRLELLGSRNSTGSNNTATFSYGAASDNVNFNNPTTGGNLTKVIILDNMTPSSGAIDVLIDHTTGTFSFICAFRLIQINP